MPNESKSCFYTTLHTFSSTHNTFYYCIHSNTDYTCDTQMYIVLHMHISTVNTLINLFASLLERRQVLIHMARTVTSLCYSIVVTQIISLVTQAIPRSVSMG